MTMHPPISLRGHGRRGTSELRGQALSRLFWPLGLGFLALATPAMATGIRESRPTLRIPRVQRPVTLEDFAGMRPSGEIAGGLVKAAEFTQFMPDAGQAPTQRTEVYLGYDDENLYVVFLAFDSEPDRIRARMARRDTFQADDDSVWLYIDAFNDQRSAYTFGCNGLGVQDDGINVPGTDTDFSWDTVWGSRGVLTPQGYAVSMAIPFKSLRFPSSSEEGWGVIFERWLPRRREDAFWPAIPPKNQNWLSYSGLATGLERISPARNLQLIPYTSARAFRADTNDGAPVGPGGSRTEGTLGLDGKLVVQDTLVLDATIRPDFSQVESDEPQSSVNQRYEVFYPEKRPFFMENASYFGLPTVTNLLFTRRIVDPEYGVRLSGKRGPWAIGALVADDRSPGERGQPSDPLQGEKARFEVVRVSHDLPGQSNLGVLLTGRDLGGGYNRVAAADGKIKLAQDWWVALLAATSKTVTPEGESSTGQAYEARLRRTGRSFNFDLAYLDRSPGFDSRAGFVTKNDIRDFWPTLSYALWPQGGAITKLTPTMDAELVWDHQGVQVQNRVKLSLLGELTRIRSFELWYEARDDVLRPKDFPGLPENRRYAQRTGGFQFAGRPSARLLWRVRLGQGTWLNLVPPAGQQPSIAWYTHGEAALSVFPFGSLSIENTYLLDRLEERASGRGIFTDHVLRSKWNWQVTRELSLRMIVRLDAIAANSRLTSLAEKRNLNGDFLVTYLLHPGTAVHLGYNTNYRRLETADAAQLLQGDGMVNDAWQVYAKVSYLLRF